MCFVGGVSLVLVFVFASFRLCVCRCRLPWALNGIKASLSCTTLTAPLHDDVQHHHLSHDGVLGVGLCCRGFGSQGIASACDAVVVTHYVRGVHHWCRFDDFILLADFSDADGGLVHVLVCVGLCSCLLLC
mgnify:CR=1 FL=1